MAQAGVFAPTTVIDAEVTVRVNGAVREHVSMDWSGDTTGGLPEQVVSAGTGMRSRTGSIKWAQEDSVEQESPHPLRRVSGWPPEQGDEVVIDATVDTGQGPYLFRRFTGRLGRTTGSLVDGSLESEITDTLADQLQAVVTIDPRLTGDYTRSFHVAYRAMEQAGLGVLPPADEMTVAQASGQGGYETEVGQRDVAAGATGYGDPYGLMAISGLRLLPTTPARGGRDVLAVGRASTVWDSSLRVSLTTGVEVTLTHRVATRRLDLFVSGAGYVWQGTSADTSPLPILALQIRGSGVRVYTSPTAWVDTSAWTAPADAGVRWVDGDFLVGRSLRRLTSSALGPQIVSRVPALPAGWFPSALEQEWVSATRGVENVAARSVVDAWSEATLASVWMDERGRTQCVARDRLVTRPVSRTLRIDERVFAGSWSVGDDSVRSRVQVAGQQVAVNRPRADENRALIYQEGSSRAVEAAEVIERFIEAPPEMEWGPIDMTASRYGDGQISGNGPALGTWIWAVSTDPDEPEPGEWWLWGGTYPGTYDIQIERLGQRTLKVTETVVPPAGRTVYLKSPSVDASSILLWAHRDVASPVIRGIWTTTWADYAVTGAARGPEWAEPLAHDAGWWLTPADAQRVADALAAEVTKPMPTLSSVTTLWDPTRQIGDVEEWVAVDRDGAESWRARVLVTGYSEAWDGRVPSQSVDVRVISWTDPLDGKTYGDLAAAYARYADMSGTYQQVYDALPNSI